MPKQVFILTDANAKIGNGHLMRCMNIAKALRNKQVEVKFIGFSDYLIHQVQKEHFSYQIVSRSKLVDDLKDILMMTVQSVGTIIVDYYDITEKELTSLQSLAPTLVFDYFFQYNQGMDGILQYHPWATEMFQQKEYKCKPGVQLLGTKFIPLGESYRKSGYSFREKARNVLLTTGSSDPLGMTKHFIDLWLSSSVLNEITLNVVVGPHFPDNYSKYLADNVKMLEGLTSLKSSMERCDILISSAGVTLYEALAIGIPTIGFSFTDNHTRQSVLDGAIVWGGDVRTNGDSLDIKQLQHILSETKKLIGATERRKHLSASGYRLVDGLGANRIAETIIKEWLI